MRTPAFLKTCSLLAGLPWLLCAQTNVLTQHNDIGRTGQNVTETILTPANVTTATFGKLLTLQVDGQMYAQPLYVSSVTINGASHRVVFVATEHDSVFAFDAASGAQLWQASLLDSAHGAAAGATTEPASETGCGGINKLGGAAEYGITSTPVIDAATGTLYVVSLTMEGGYPVQRLHALDFTTGNEKFGGPVTLAASVAGTGNGSSNGVLKFDPEWELQRAGLLELNGNIYIAFASYCDFSAWHGWILGYNAATLAQTAALVMSPNGLGSGIWMSGAGLAADIESGVGRIFPVLGNGTYDATPPYGANTMDYGDDILNLTLSTSGALRVADAFTPLDQAAFSAADRDVGSGGALVLPDQPGSYPHLLAQVGKSGDVYLINRDSMGGYSTTSNNIVEQISALYGLYGLPAYWNENLYVWPGDGSLGRYPMSNGLLPASPSESSTQVQSNSPRYGLTPSISANGSQNGILWAIDYTQSPQVLYAFNASNVSQLLWSSNQNATRDSAGGQQKFAVPTVADGNVFVGSSNNQVLVYGLLSTACAAAPITPYLEVNSGAWQQAANATVAAGSTVNFGPQPMGGSWSWSGPNGFTASTREIDGIPLSTGTNTFVATYTDVNSCTSTLSFVVTVSAASPSFTLSSSASTASVTQGSSISDTITAAGAGGFSGNVTLAASGLPSGVTAAFSVNPTSGSSVLTLTTSSTATPGTSTVTITGTSGSLSASANIALTVNAASNCAIAAITPYLEVNGGAWQQAASVTVSAGSSVNLGPQPVYGAWTWTGPNGFTASTRELDSVPLSAGTNTFVATIVDLSCTNTQTFVVTVTPSVSPSFTLSPSPASLAVSQGGSTTDTITVAGSGGFSGNVTLAAAGLPSGVTAAFSANPASGSSVITLTASSTAVTGASTVTVTGTSGALTASTAIPLKVSASGSCSAGAITPFIEVNGAAWQQAANATVAAGSVVNVGPQPIGGTWSWSGPNGFTANIREIDAIPLSAGANTYIATYTDVNSCTSTQTFVITVPPPSPSFALAPANSSLAVTPGGSGSDTITVTDVGGFSGSVTLAVSGLPGGVTAAFSANPAAGSSVITFSAGSSAAAGTSTITVTGTSGSLTASTTIVLTIGASIPCGGGAITPYLEVNGGVWQQASAVTVAPGATVNLGPQPVYGTWSWAGPNGFTASTREIDAIPLPTGANTFVATYTDVNSCVSTQAFVISVTGNSGSFTLSPASSSLAISQGSGASDTITVADAGGFSGNVTLAVSGLPSGVTAAINPNPTTGSSVLTLTASSAATAGAATVTITGTSGNLTASTTVALTVNYSTPAVVTANGPYAALTNGTNSVTFNVITPGYLGTPAVFTEGSPSTSLKNPDFILASTGTTCSGSVGGASCTVTVAFTPQFAGLRRGAVKILDASGNLLATAFVYGVGAGSQPVLTPSSAKAIYSTGSPRGVAVDGAGDVFLIDTSTATLYKVSPGGTPAALTLGFTLSLPFGVAVDGAGNLYIADTGNSRILKLPYGSSAATVVNAAGLTYPEGVAVDASGNLLIANTQGAASSGYGNVIKIAAGSGTQTTLASGGLGYPTGVAVDAAGDVFFADWLNNRVLELPAGGGASRSMGTGLGLASGVAVDAAGDVFITDEANNRVVEVLGTASGPGTGTQVVAATGLSMPYSLAFDGMGDLFVASAGSNFATDGSVTEIPN